MQTSAPALPLEAQFMQMAMGFMVSQAMAVSARLKIADLVADGGKTTAELAAALNSSEPSLYRFLRALASFGLMSKDEHGRFSNTPLGEFLRTDHPQSMQGACHMMGDAEHWNSHGNLQHSVVTGGIGFDHTFGMPVFPYFQQNPGAAEVFDRSMTSFSAAVAESVANSYDFGGAGTIADIAGGQGLLLARLLRSNPAAKGVLFEQPSVLGSNVIAAEGLSDRVECVAGDFFDSIPVVADTYIMKSIIHDWNDEQAIAILRNLALSAPDGSRLLLVEMVVEEDDNQPSLSKLMDLNMMVMTGGKERTPSEYASLLTASGFQMIEVHPTQPLQIIEAVKRG